MSYKVIAPFYDTIMNHVNYHDWADLILRVKKKFVNKSGIDIFEIGAGTGTLGSLLISSPLNCRYYGSDLCFDMAFQATRKKLAFFCADGRYLPLKKEFDLILFLYDGINYLSSLSDYLILFKSVASLLSSGGLFLFDITTKENSFRYFFDVFDFQEIEKTTIIRHSYYLPKKYLQKNDFLFFSPVVGTTDLFQKKFEDHSQKIFNPDQIEKTIPKNLFNCLGIWDGFTMDLFNNSSERIHFLLQKK